MKFEISDLLNDKNKYALTILRMHIKANKNVLTFLIMKIMIYDNIIIHALFIIISAMGLLILTSDFIPDYNSNYKYISICFRFLTPYSFVEKFQLSNYEYIIICSVIFIICIIRLSYMCYFIYKINHYHSTEICNITINIFVLILNHISYVLFSYINEFLSFIYYIEIFPNNFIIKKDSKLNIKVHRLFIVLNSLLIILYNINNYIFISLINRPTYNKSNSFRIKIPQSKLYIFILFQNFGLLHPLQCYLKTDTNTIWTIIINISIFILFSWIYFRCIKLYFYNNILNRIISYIGEFCFMSIVFEFLLFVFSLKKECNIEMVIFIIIKLLLTSCLDFILQFIYRKVMINKMKKKIFYNNPHIMPFDNNLNECILYIREIMKEKNMKMIIKIIELFNRHKKQCLNNNCGCKIIKINNKIKFDKMKFIDDIINKMNYFIESILIFYNYHNNFDLALLLSEHFLIFRKNPIMSYSILQALIHYNYKNLNRKQLIILYETMSKYINYILVDKKNRIITEELNEYHYSLASLKNKENEIKQYINLILKINKVVKYMIYYSTRFINIILHKDNYEDSSIAKINEIDKGIKYITSPYLNSNIINKLIDFIYREIVYTSDIKKYLYDLEEYSLFLSYEFLYKIFLFVDFFWNRKIPNNLLNIFYSFTTNRNLYTIEIKPEIYKILEIRHNDLLILSKRKYYILFKYTKGLKISYISESLLQKLYLKKNKIIKNEIDVLLINELISSHNNAIKHFFIYGQNYLYKNQFKFIFDYRKYMINTKMNSTLQIGVNKNILIICVIELLHGNKNMFLYTDKNLKIISINDLFEEGISLSLPLIEEFQIELKDIFGIDVICLHKFYKKEIKKVKKSKEFKILNTKEYILRNLFNYQNQNNYHISNKFYIKNDSDESEKEEEEKVKLNQKKGNNSNIIDKLFSDDYKKLNVKNIKPINFKIDNEAFLINLRKIFEKINSYELDKLERKNIYNDFLLLNNNYNELVHNKNIFFNLKIQPRLIYDTLFYICKVDKYIVQNITEINSNNQLDSYEFNTCISETEELNSSSNISLIKKRVDKNEKNLLDNIVKLYRTDTKNFEDKNKLYLNAISNSNYCRDEIKVYRPSKNKFCFLLLSCIIALLISCIMAFYYQINLINKNEKLFKVFYYNYFQRTQFLYLHSILLSMYFELINITDIYSLDDNKYILNLIAKNLDESHILFRKYYLELKIELNEDFSLLFEPLFTKKIEVNWEKVLSNNSYETELSLIVHKVVDSINHEFNEEDIIDCENFLLKKYLYIDRKITPVYGNFIRLLYYFYHNYYDILRNFFLNLEKTFYLSNKYSKNTTVVILAIEIIGIILLIIFFVINSLFLIRSNKYIFQNILYMFMDFSQSDNYSFNNKESNLNIIQKITNYILLLKEFNRKNLESFKQNKEIKNFINLKTLLEEEKNDELYMGNKIIGKKVKNKEKKDKIILANRTISDKRLIYASSLAKFKSDKSLLEDSKPTNHSNTTITKSKIKNKSIELNEGIHALNKKDINDILNNSSIMNNSKNDSSNLLLNISISNSIDLKRRDNKDIKETKIKITIEKILFKTKINIIYSIKLIIIVFVVLTIIFIVYYICKLIVTLIFISNFKYIIDDFKDFSNQYSQIIAFWNNLKTLFIIPNSTIYCDFNDTDKYFYNLNNKVYQIYNNRIKRYKRISKLYNAILTSSSEQNVEFCNGNVRCNEIKDSKNYILSNGIASTVDIYSKEMSAYYKIYLYSKNNINNKKEIIKAFINERYKILSFNINYVFFSLELFFFNQFLADEEDIISYYFLIIKTLNIVEICYCLLLNIFSFIFVYPYIISIISTVETSSTRINHSILRLKHKNPEEEEVEK